MTHPSTVSTIIKTGDKLVFPGEVMGETCPMCQLYVYSPLCICIWQPVELALTSQTRGRICKGMEAADSFDTARKDPYDRSRSRRASRLLGRSRRYAVLCLFDDFHPYNTYEERSGGSGGAATLGGIEGAQK